MKHLFIFVLGFLAYFSLNAQGRICVQHGATSTFTSRFDSAMIIAQTNDILYLPGGSVPNNNSSYSITKKVRIIGAGYHSDSSLATLPSIMVGTLTFQSGGAGSLVMGVNVTGTTTITSSNDTLSRCLLSAISISNSVIGSCQNIYISENIIRGVLSATISGNNLLNFNVNKNILYSSVSGILGGTFFNNAFLTSTTLGNTSQSYFFNNIFLYPSGGIFNGNGITYNTFSNNLFVVDSSLVSWGTNMSLNNIFNQSVNTIFVNHISLTSWSKSDNFHLKPICLGVNAGNDGTDIGIYGTSAPFKEGGKTLAPHIRTVNIPSSSAPNGFLTIDIIVEAQQN